MSNKAKPMNEKNQGMRRKLTDYGDANFSLYLRKAFIKAMGFTDDALSRPVIGIANTFSSYNACHATVPQIVEAIKRGVMVERFDEICAVARLADQLGFDCITKGMHYGASPLGDYQQIPFQLPPRASVTPPHTYST